MEELKNQIAKLGIDASQIQGVIDTVLGFVKSKLPESLHGTIDSALSGEGGGAGDLLGKAKDLLGGFMK